MIKGQTILFVPNLEPCLKTERGGYSEIQVDLCQGGFPSRRCCSIGAGRHKGDKGFLEREPNIIVGHRGLLLFGSQLDE